MLGVFGTTVAKRQTKLANPTKPKNPKTSLRKHSKTLRKIKKTTPGKPFPQKVGYIECVVL